MQRREKGKMSLVFSFVKCYNRDENNKTLLDYIGEDIQLKNLIEEFLEENSELICETVLILESSLFLKRGGTYDKFDRAVFIELVKVDDRVLEVFIVIKRNFYLFLIE